jgi:hypothetical protein
MRVFAALGAHGVRISTGQQKAVCIKIPLICVKSFSDMNEHASF